MATAVKDKHSTGLNATMGTIAWIIAIITVGYMVPWAIAVSRGKTNSTAICLLNALLGWTLIGWIIALVMAVAPHQLIPQAVIVPPAAPSPPQQQPAPTAAPAGWYAQPDGTHRYWTGTAWAPPPTT